MQADYVEGVERNDQETQATIERERVTSAAVKQLRAEIKEEKAKHEEQVRPMQPCPILMLPTCSCQALA